MSEKKKVGDLRENPGNPRKIGPEQLKMLAKAMAEFGDLSGVIKCVRSGNLVGGHQRVKILDKSWPIVITEKYSPANPVGTTAEGYIETPWGRWVYREVDWDERKEKAALIAANHHGGEDNIPQLKDLLTELNDGEFDIELTGFNEDDLAELINYDPNANLRPLEPQALTMTWVLIGVPIGAYPKVAPLVQQAQEIAGAVVEVAANARHAD